MSFRSNASIEKFKEVLLDGKVLDSQYYTVKEGSTIITLHPEFTKTLSEGQHTLMDKQQPNLELKHQHQIQSIHQNQISMIHQTIKISHQQINLKQVIQYK